MASAEDMTGSRSFAKYFLSTRKIKKCPMWQVNVDITGRPEISIILPTYDERDNILDLISEISLYLSNHIGRPFEFVVVDDDSEDKTWQAVQEKFGNGPRVKIVRRMDEKGLASAILRGIQEAKGKIVAWMDCDFSMPPYKLVELIKKVDEGYDVAVGSRFIKGAKDIRGLTDSWLAVALSRVVNYFISFVLGLSFKDYTSGFVAARRDIFDKIEIKGNYGEYFIDFIYRVKKLGYKIIEVPYYCLPRRKGYSKTGVSLMDYFKKGWKYIFLTLKLKLKN